MASSGDWRRSRESPSNKGLEKCIGARILISYIQALPLGLGKFYTFYLLDPLRQRWDTIFYSLIVNPLGPIQRLFCQHLL